MNPGENPTPYITTSPMDGGDVRVLAGARLADIAMHLRVRTAFPLLADACEHDARDSDGRTLGESLAPATACKRTGDVIFCALNASATCAASDPRSELHAIIAGGPCWRSTTSMIAVALVALEAAIEVAELAGRRWMSADDFLALHDEVLPEGEQGARAVVSVRVPAAAAGGFQRIIRTEHAPRISLAAVRRTDGDVRLVLGGVSPRPYRVYGSVEEEAVTEGLDEETIEGLAERALLDAEYQPENAARVDDAASLLREAIREISTAQFDA